MKRIIVIAMLLASLSAKSQSVTYELDIVSPDSFFLVEKIVAAPTPENPRPGTQVNNQLYHSKAALLEFMATLNNKAKDYLEMGKMLATRSKNIKAALDKAGKKLDQK